MLFGNTVSGFSAPLGSVAIGAYPDSASTSSSSSAARRCCWSLRLAGAALHAARPDRPRHHAEPAHGGGPRRRSGQRSTPSPSPSAPPSPGLAGGADGADRPASCRPWARPTSPRPSSPSSPAARRSWPARRSASALLGAVDTVGTFLTTPVLGEVALLVAAIVLLRLLPQGITGRFFRRALVTATGRAGVRSSRPRASWPAGARRLAGCRSVLELFALINATDLRRMAVLALSAWRWSGATAASSASARRPSSASAATPTPWPPSTSATARRPCRWRSLVPTLVAAIARLLHVLRPHQRRLHGRHHAHGDADPLQASSTPPPGEQWTHRRRRRWAASTASRRPRRSTCRATPATPLDARADLRRRRRLLLAGCYVVCTRSSCASRFGRVVVAIRENELRAELLGYDVRLYKLGIFTIGGADGRARRHACSPTASSSARPCSRSPISGADHHLGASSAASARCSGRSSAASCCRCCTRLGRHAAGASNPNLVLGADPDRRPCWLRAARDCCRRRRSAGLARGGAGRRHDGRCCADRGR